MERIKQAYVSQSISAFKAAFMSKYDFAELQDLQKPALFFGMYRPEDLYKILEHEGPTLLVWGGTDALRSQRYSNELASKKNIKHIAISSHITNSLRKNGIASNYIPITPTHLLMNVKKRGENIYFYHGSDDPEIRKIYGGQIVDQLKEILPFNIIETTKSSFSREELVKVYESCFVGLRLNEHDGLPNTVCELGLMGRRCIYNGELPNAINFIDIDDIVSKLYVEYERRNEDNQKIGISVFDFLNVGESWLYI